MDLSGFSLIDGTVAVEGENVMLLAVAADYFLPSVIVNFTAEYTSAKDGSTKKGTWTEFLHAFHNDSDSSASPGKTSLIPWKVNLQGLEADPDYNQPERKPAKVSFVVNGIDDSKTDLTAASKEPLVVQVIVVTALPDLVRIMFHEFAKPKTGGGFEFDPAPVRQFARSLDPHQRKILANYQVTGPGRLVTFITLYSKSDRLMGADFCANFPTTVRPNATFTVFHCQGPSKPVTLVTHTAFFLLNLVNPHTNALVHAAIKGKPANEWMKRENPTPPVFKIGAMRPSHMTDGVIWHRIFRADGTDVMPGNSMHGVINTVGCWMTYRNYNWPRSKYEQFYNAYEKMRMDPSKNKGSHLVDLLVPLGYDKKPTVLSNTGGVVKYNLKETNSSFRKFMLFDLNFAFFWFNHFVLGISYCSKSTTFYADSMNDWHPHGLEFLPTFAPTPAEQATFPPRGYFDTDVRSKEDGKPFVADDSLLGNNSLGFQPAAKFTLDPMGAKQPDVDARTWCDLFLYHEDDVNMNKLHSNY